MSLRSRLNILLLASVAGLSGLVFKAVSVAVGGQLRAAGLGLGVWQKANKVGAIFGSEVCAAVSEHTSGDQCGRHEDQGDTVSEEFTVSEKHTASAGVEGKIPSRGQCNKQDTVTNECDCASGTVSVIATNAGEGGEICVGVSQHHTLQTHGHVRMGTLARVTQSL